MGEKSIYAVGRGIFRMEEAKTMGPDDSNKSRHSLPMDVGNDKRVDRKNKAKIWEPQRTKFNVSEAEEIELWSPSYPRSLQTVCIGNSEQSVGQIRIHDSKPIAEILSSTHRAPCTRARM